MRIRRGWPAAGLLLAALGLHAYFQHVRSQPLLSWPEVCSIFPAARTLQPPEGRSGLRLVRDARGQRLGWVLVSSSGADAIRGYAGPTPLLIGLTLQGRIQGIQLLPNAESGDFLDRVIKTGLLARWQGKTPDDARMLAVDTVAGATYTSRAIIRTVQAQLSRLNPRALGPVTPAGSLDWGILLLASLALLLSFVHFSHSHWLRLGLLLLSLLYLGFYRASFLSISLFAGWIRYGVLAAETLTMLLLAGLSAGLLLMFRKPLYCSYLCPFGALQELVHTVLPWHRPLPPVLRRRLRWVRYFLLLLCAGALAFSPMFDFSLVEPFAAFLLGLASRWVLILAGIILVFSPFQLRPWCTYVCPTGVILDLLRK